MEKEIHCDVAEFCPVGYTNGLFRVCHGYCTRTSLARGVAVHGQSNAMDKFCYLPCGNGLYCLHPMVIFAARNLRPVGPVHQIYETKNRRHNDVRSFRLGPRSGPRLPADSGADHTVESHPPLYNRKELRELSFNHYNGWVSPLTVPNGDYKFDHLGLLDCPLNPMASVQV